MSEINYIADYEQRASRLARRLFRNAPRIDAVLRTGGRGAQQIEDMSFDALVSDNPDHATGEALDRWGRIVGEQRRGLNDRDYRRFIRARILANISPDDIDSIVEVWRVLTEPDDVSVHWLRPAAYALVTHREAPLESHIRDRIRRLMESIQPAGVGLKLIEAPRKDDTYTYDNGPGLDEGAFGRIL